MVAMPSGTYHQPGVSSLQRLFRVHFPQLPARYEAEFTRRLGKFRLERITNAVERFLGCGDYRRGFAKRTPLLGEYMNELLLRLPHRQFVFTPRSGYCTDIPKVLRAFFRHDYLHPPNPVINLKAEAFIPGGLQ